MKNLKYESEQVRRGNLLHIKRWREDEVETWTRDERETKPKLKSFQVFKQVTYETLEFKDQATTRIQDFCFSFTAGSKQKERSRLCLWMAENKEGK